MDVSVVITTYNDDKRLALVLQGLARQEGGRPFRVVVVDDGGDNTVNTQYLVKKCGYEYFYLAPATSDFRLAKARNLGIAALDRQSRALFCDCDTVPTSNHIVVHGSGGDRDILIGMRSRISISRSDHLCEIGVLPPEPMLRELAYRVDDREIGDRAQELADLENGKNKAPWKICWGCNFSAPVSMLQDLGGFDESFVGWGGEDEDMAERLYRVGAIFKATRDSRVYHLDHPLRTAQSAVGTYLKSVGGPLVRNGGPMVPCG